MHLSQFQTHSAVFILNVGKHFRPDSQILWHNLKWFSQFTQSGLIHRRAKQNVSRNIQLCFVDYNESCELRWPSCIVKRVNNEMQQIHLWIRKVFIFCLLYWIFQNDLLSFPWNMLYINLWLNSIPRRLSVQADPNFHSHFPTDSVQLNLYRAANLRTYIYIYIYSNTTHSHKKDERVYQFLNGV